MASPSRPRRARRRSAGDGAATLELTGDRLLTVADYERASREVLPRQLFDVLFGGQGANSFEAEERNLEAFRAVHLRPRVMSGVAERKLSTSVLGHPVSLPVLLAPAGYHQRAHPDGELATVRAAHGEGTVLTVSTASTFTIEEIAAASNGPLWFQLYMFKSREVDERLIRRAEQAGYKALMITVDHHGRSREREIRYDFGRTSEHRTVHTIDPERVLINFREMDFAGVPTSDAYRDQFDFAFTWQDLDWVRSVTSLPIILKGIQTAEDARLCVEHGVDAIVVSNHGGHASPNARATLEALPEIVAAAGAALEVYLDGGVRRGGDVLKAIAMGARCVLIGRPIFWGLAVDGERGVREVLRVLKAELDSEMSLCGVGDVERVDPRLVATPLSWRTSSPGVDTPERLSGWSTAGASQPKSSSV